MMQDRQKPGPEEAVSFLSSADDDFPFGDTRDELYDQSIRKLYGYRQKLCQQLGKPNDFDLERYQLFQSDFCRKLDEARSFVDECRAGKPVDEMLTAVNDRLVAKAMIRQRTKLLLQLFQLANRCVRLVDTTVAAIERDFQKSAKTKTMSVEQIRTVRQNYGQIVNVFNVLIQIQVRPDTTLYRYFYDYIRETNAILIDLAQKLFQWSFTLVRWPCIALDCDSDSPPTAQNLELFRELVRLLLELETGDFRLPPENEPIKKNQVKKLPLFERDADIPSLVMRLMVEPLIKRFRFHFLSPNSKLNNIENPEWYLCQVEQWITRNEPFLEEHIDPVFQEYFSAADNKFRSAKYQLISQLLEMIKTKLKQDAVQLADDRIFSLTLDEVIIFNKQIAFIQPEIYEEEPRLNPLSVFFDDPFYYDRFVQIERNKLNEFIESIFESETSWSLVYGVADDSKFIICEAADKFALLIQNLIERSTYIPDRDYQRKIFGLIAEILDDFRLRLSQLIHDYSESWPFSQKFFSILNTFDFMLALINDLNLNSMLNDDGHDQDDKMASLSKTFQHMIDEIFDRIIQVIISDFLFDLQEYKKIKWHGMSVSVDRLELSKPAVTMFYNFSTKINLVKKFISGNLFEEFLFEVAAKIQDVLFEHFVMKHSFNKDGVLQLEFDIKHGLFAIFSVYMKNVQYTFGKISDCLLVLNLSPQTIRNLRHRDLNSEIEFKVYLQTLGIYALRPATVMKLIDRRIGFN